jgi:rhodanese-related sulfurtransferase
MKHVGRALVLVAAAAACAVISNALASPERRLRLSAGLSPSGSRRPGVVPIAAGDSTPAPPSAGALTFPPHPDKPWTEVSGDQVAALRARADVPVLDARRTSVYRDGHIAGARPFSVWEADADEKVKAFYGEGHEPDAPIVVYCSGGDCEDSHMLGQKLFLAGFNNVLVYKDGFPDWAKRGLPVTKGEKP